MMKYCVENFFSLASAVQLAVAKIQNLSAATSHYFHTTIEKALK
jgi:hypothetical protein